MPLCGNSGFLIVFYRPYKPIAAVFPHMANVVLFLLFGGEKAHAVSAGRNQNIRCKRKEPERNLRSGSIW